MIQEERMVIVGGGQCGARAAHALRSCGWKGAVTLIGGEKALPYERPPLSKAVLTGESRIEGCMLYDQSAFDDQRIDTLFGLRVINVERRRKRVHLDDGSTVDYTKLLLATGATARTLAVPGHTLPGVHTLRTDTDAHDIARRLAPGRRIAIIGAGFIGLEVAASAIRRGCKVVVLEAAPRALIRAVPSMVAERIVDLHRSMGVEIHFGVDIACFVGNGEVCGIQLTSGENIACDAAIVGIGVVACAGLAEQAGLEVSDGIVVDEYLRTSDPSIFAAGDACSFKHPLFGKRIRLECWKNAEDQARIAAVNMLGRDEPCAHVPWFWSDHYDTTVQIAGLPTLGTNIVVRETGHKSRIFFALSADNVLLGASGVGSIGDIARDIRVAQELIARRMHLPPDALTDRTVKLRSLMATEAL